MKKMLFASLAISIAIIISSCSGSTQPERLLGTWECDSVEVYDSGVNKWKRYDGFTFLKIELIEKKLKVSRGCILKDTTKEWFGPFPLKKTGKNKWEYKDLAFIVTIYMKGDRLIGETSKHIVPGVWPMKGMYRKTDYP